MRLRRPANPFGALTPEAALRLHLGKARDYWRADRLDLAIGAVKEALAVGVPVGDWYDLQRTIEAEWGARRDGRIDRIGEQILLEAAGHRAAPQPFGQPQPRGPKYDRVLIEAQRQVEEMLDLRWGKPVLVTLIPHEEWVEFMHARYGYYAERAPWHKVCLPPSAASSPETLRRAALHEITHAAVHQLAGDAVPRWLDEGLAMLLEGGISPRERRWLEAREGTERPSLDAISAGFERFDVAIGSARSLASYHYAHEFVRYLATAAGLSALRKALAHLGHGVRVDRAFRAAGIVLRKSHATWVNA